MHKIGGNDDDMFCTRVYFNKHNMHKRITI